MLESLGQRIACHEDTFKDIDLHRYKCTQCGEIGYYSGAAENYYTKGIKNPMLGPSYD